MVSQGNKQQPDCLVLNHLPFAEDLRVAKFASLDEKPDLLPSTSQLDQMRTLVESMDLFTGAMQVTKYSLQVSKIFRKTIWIMCNEIFDGCRYHGSPLA